EGTGSNIFYVVGEQLVTPTLHAGPLAGVTRALVLEWCADELDVGERDAPTDVPESADGVILVGTPRDGPAMSSVDGRERRAPGPVPRRAQGIWAREAAKGIDP